MNNMYEQLTEEFPKNVEQKVRKGGVQLTYIPVSEVIARLNRVAGFDNWSQQIVFVGRDTHDPDYVTAHVRLTVALDGVAVSRDGVGGQKIKRTKSGEIVDLGDEYKGAVSDAFKKACQTLGIGLYLARSEEALAAEIEMREPDTASVELFGMLRQATAKLDSEQKKRLRAFWSNTFGDLPVGAEAGSQALTAAIAQATEMLNQESSIEKDLLNAFPGSEVIDE
jgi:recombination DNA repair RAD52 pathway protein